MDEILLSEHEKNLIKAYRIHREEKNKVDTILHIGEDTEDFKAWLVKFDGVDLPIGDLAHDVAEDDDFPAGDCISEILDHLSTKRSSLQAIDTCVTAWNFYIASR